VKKNKNTNLHKLHLLLINNKRKTYSVHLQDRGQSQAQPGQQQGRNKGKGKTFLALVGNVYLLMNNFNKTKAAIFPIFKAFQVG